MTAMKFIFGLLVFAVFAAGIGLGGVIGLQLPANDAINFETYTTSSRGLTFNEVKLAEPSGSANEPLEPTLSQPQVGGPVERNSPSDWIKESQIEMRPDGVFIHFENPQWAILANTNSMDPLMDDTSHALQVFPTSPEQIHVGDIVSYKSPLDFTIIHRVIEIGNDEDGWYIILKGDNNPTPDPWKVRWDMVTRVTVAVIY